MKTLPPVESINGPAPADHEASRDVYRHSLEVLQRSGIPYLVGGAFALESYTGVKRRTKDLDVFARPHDVESLLKTLSDAGYRTERRFPHWLAKAFKEDHFIDIIFGSGNGVCAVDDLWFEHADCGTVLDLSVRIVPPEEMIWSKAFIMERERYDGADIAHIILERGKTLNWSRLLYRFHTHWRVLFSHLVLFGFIYPAHRLTVPKWLMDELIRRLHLEMACLPAGEPTCQGTLLSWSQYLTDVEGRGYIDARHSPRGSMSVADTRSISAMMTEENSKAE